MTLIYGHRGAKGIAPENTLASFQACLATGVTRCELDVQLSSDQQIVVFHDTRLKKLTGRRGKTQHKTAAQLAQLDVRYAGPSWPTPCPIPTLAVLFEQCHFTHWQIEIKPLSNKKAVVLLAELVRLCEKYHVSEQITLTSSSLRVLKLARQHAPQLARGYVAEYRWLDPIKIAIRLECSLLAMKWNLCSATRIQRAKRAGLQVSVWTVNEPALMNQLVRYGVDSLITDFPGLAIATLGNR